MKSPPYVIDPHYIIQMTKFVRYICIYILLHNTKKLQNIHIGAQTKFKTSNDNQSAFQKCISNSLEYRFI